MRFLAVFGLWLAGLVMFFQNTPPPTSPASVTFISPSAGASLMGLVSVDVTVTGTVLEPSFVAVLTKDGVFGTVSSSPLTKSGNGHYIAVIPLPAVTAPTNYSVTATDGVVASARAFVVAPAAPQPATIETAIGLMQAGFGQAEKNRDLILLAIANIRKAVEPEPAPVGIGCRVVSATTVYKDTPDGDYKLTLRCPKAVSPAGPPAKEDKLQLLGVVSSSAVVK